MPGLLLAVVPVDGRQERVGVGVLAGQLLHEVGDLLAGDHHHVERGRVPEDPRLAEAVELAGADVADERVLGRGADLLDDPLEQPLVRGSPRPISWQR